MHNGATPGFTGGAHPEARVVEAQEDDGCVEESTLWCATIRQSADALSDQEARVCAPRCPLQETGLATRHH